MDKFEYKIRTEEIRALIAKGEYAEAASIADTIDWRRVKSSVMLCTISDLYKINRRFEDAKDMLLLAYDRHPGGRAIVYSLCELCIKMEQIVEALGYYKEFVQVAPRDSGRYVLKYKIFEAQEVTLEERIEVLEELKGKDYSEKWAYELAYLYHRVGLATRCVEECDELILWFGDGKYVRKALELKQLHEPLSPEQQEKYDRMRMPAETAPEQAPAEERNYAEEEPDLLNAPTREIPQKDLDIQVKVMNVGQYDTINMQKALAENMKEILEEPAGQTESRSLPEENFVNKEPEASDTGMFDLPDEEDEEIEEGGTGEIADEAILPSETKVEEVFFGETGEIDNTGTQVLDEMKREAQEQKTANAAADTSVGESADTSEEISAEPSAEAVKQPVIREMMPEEQPAVREYVPKEEPAAQESVPKEEPAVQPRAESGTKAPIINFFTQQPSKFDNILGMEYDGQLNIVVPDSEQVEKQITGQLQLEDVLLEWEKIKKNNEQKRMEAVRQHVLEQTGPIFTEFDAAARDGLLEQLEKSGLDEDDSEETSGELKVMDGEGISEEAAEILDESVSTEIEEELEEVAESTEAEEAAAVLETAAAEAEEADEDPDEAATEGTEEAAEEFGKEAENEKAEGVESEAVKKEAENEAGEESESNKAGDAESETAEKETENGTGESAEEESAEPAEEAQGEEPAKSEEARDEEPAENVDSEKNKAAKEKTERERKPGKPEEKQTAKAKEAGGDKGGNVRELSEEERRLFASYTQNRKTREQIVHAIDNVSMAAYTGNVIITGGEGADTLTLAKNLVKEIQQTDSNFSGKIAKISAESLNRKEMGPILDRLQNGALIVQNCGELNEETVGRLRSALDREHNGLVVLMEGTKKAVNKMLRVNAGLAECFNIRIDIEELDNDSLVEYGKKYAKEQEYSIDDFGMLALHTRIAERQTSDHAVTVAEVKELVDGAIIRANRKSFNHFIDILMAKRYDEEDMIILREKDFM